MTNIQTHYPTIGKFSFPKLTTGSAKTVMPAIVWLIQAPVKGSKSSDFSKEFGKAIQSLPKGIQAHAALKGERGAVLVVHSASAKGKTHVFLGIGKNWTNQDAYMGGELLGQRLSQEKVQQTRLNLAKPSAPLQKGRALNFIKGLAISKSGEVEFKSKADSSVKLQTIEASPDLQVEASELKELQSILCGIALARHWTALPPSVADPIGLTGRFLEAVKTLKLEKNLSVEIWDEKRLAKEGVGLVLAVGQASPTPPRMVIVRYGYDPKKEKPELALVGKGITFDTGGHHLKVHDWKSLLEMNTDMAGGASVLSAMLSIALLKVKRSVLAVVPYTSNAIGPEAVLPGDVIKSYSGKTVEIQNTDAEGRLILADALHFAVKEGAKAIIDLATLTGGCQRALGEWYSGLLSNHEGLSAHFEALSEACGEPAWPLPMHRAYGEVLTSKVADIGNSGFYPFGSAQVGGKFLENFVAETPWCHLDIAGSSQHPPSIGLGSAYTATGALVHTLVELAKSGPGV